MLLLNWILAEAAQWLGALMAVLPTIIFKIAFTPNKSNLSVLLSEREIIFSLYSFRQHLVLRFWNIAVFTSYPFACWRYMQHLVWCVLLNEAL